MSPQEGGFHWTPQGSSELVLAKTRELGFPVGHRLRAPSMEVGGLEHF